MTAINQDFSTYAGDSAIPQFAIVDGSGAPIDLSGAHQITFTVQRSVTTTPVLQKTLTGGGITFVNPPGANGKIQVAILPADTSVLTGQYIHEVVIVDSTGAVSTVATGVMEVGRMPEATFSGDPAISPVDQVRFLIQDTNMDSPLLSDEGITWMLVTFPNVFLAAAQCCRVIATKFAQQVNKRVGDLSINYSDKVKNYIALADELELQGELGGLVPYAGGISRSDKWLVRQNTDRVRPPFRLKQFDNPSGPNNTSQTEFDPNPLP